MDSASDGRFRMTFSRAGQPERVATVDRTVGSHRYQQYLTKIADTYWRLPVAWSVADHRWFPMTSAFLFRDPDPAAAGGVDGRPVFGGGDFDRHVTRWNDNCVFCHNVGPNPRFDPATGRFDTTTAELGIACEACHGPGAAHVGANADPFRRLWLWARSAADPTIVNPARLSPARAADVCGRCHGQRLAADVAPFMAHGDPFVPGDDLAFTTEPLWRDTLVGGAPAAFAPRFWADGTPRLTAYEYQGLLQSRCAQEGSLTCTTCHGMHEGEPRGQLRDGPRGAAADGMCTRCHTTLADGAAATGHTHHEAASDGARCVGCHMPRVVYGVLDVHRSHRIEVPDPARAAAAGRPDACTGCHVGETPVWAATMRARLWGGTTPSVPETAGPLEALFSGDSVTRAVSADALGREQVPLGPAARATRVGALLETMAGDDYPAVRHLAWRALGRLGVDGAADYDPSADGRARRAAVERVRARPGGEGTKPAPEVVARLRARAVAEDVEIGE
jgi:predicted CXXCH cytochrome family protein